ncbi:unnamed protein product [Brassicogethes aeneus]|uniref:Sulfhydryl oxidase n=1 Tax=Brassicogethes aeneus TaxID=1431903 RepID=A0A9P0ATT7_BRAAE|nr:unnamed protein product [Brassicogethes aeneus]
MFKLSIFLLTVCSLVPFSKNAAVDMFKNKFKKQTDEVVGLYSLKDDVDILTIHNFKQDVFGSEKVWIVEFYNSYCGFCQRFAPSWKEFATDVRGWKDVVRVGAIDCANDENNPLCREFEIMGYPTLKYFHEKYAEGANNFGLAIKAGSGAAEHKKVLINTIVNEQTENRGKYLPNLLPYSASTADDLLKNRPATVKHMFLVVQEPESYMGQSLILDLNKVSDTVIKYTLNNNTALLTSLNLHKTPSVLVWDVNGNQRELDVAVDPKKTVLDYLHIKTNENNKGSGENTGVEAPSLQQENMLDEKIRKMGDAVFQKDLETALRYSLRREVSRTKEITGDKLVALKKYLDVLIKYFPFGKYGRSFLLELKQFVGSSDTIDGGDIFKIVKAAEKEERQVFSSPEGWLGCKGSAKTYRGYSCGLWRLFHYLTVNHAEQNVDNPAANPKEVLEAMHGYVKEFFGCTDCSTHFQEMSKRRNMFEVKSLPDSVLWLWSAHNEVNNRLAGDETEDPGHPKVQFPVKDRCPACHLDDDSWDTGEVLKYLKHVYSSINVRYIDSDTRILHLGLDGNRNATSGSSGFFHTIDARLLPGFSSLVCLITSIYYFSYI